MTPRQWTIALFVVFGAYLLYMGVRSAIETIDVNDYEVFHNAGGLAAKRDPRLYDAVSPVKQRGFLYPPSAAILLVPLTWLSHDALGVVCSVLKVGCLALLLWGAARFSGSWMSEDLPIPVPGLLAVPYHCGLFITLLPMLGLLVALAADCGRRASAHPAAAERSSAA
ncbi:MAG: hypothetical protein ACYS0G_12390 [Planctomycetota bacterium]|jgi:hypothetical protein